VVAAPVEKKSSKKGSTKAKAAPKKAAKAKAAPKVASKQKSSKKGGEISGKRERKPSSKQIEAQASLAFDEISIMAALIEDDGDIAEPKAKKSGKGKAKKAGKKAAPVEDDGDYMDEEGDIEGGADDEDFSPSGSKKGKKSKAKPKSAKKGAKKAKAKSSGKGKAKKVRS